MVTNFFWIGYHFEEFRSQVAIRKKKVNFTPCSMMFIFLLVHKLFYVSSNKKLQAYKD